MIPIKSMVVSIFVDVAVFTESLNKKHNQKVPVSIDIQAKITLLEITPATRL